MMNQWPPNQQTPIQYSSNQHTPIRLPIYVGYWNIDDSLFLYKEKKPNWFHRTMMKLCLGIKWVDTVASDKK